MEWTYHLNAIANESQNLLLYPLTRVTRQCRFQNRIRKCQFSFNGIELFLVTWRNRAYVLRLNHEINTRSRYIFRSKGEWGGHGGNVTPKVLPPRKPARIKCEFPLCVCSSLFRRALVRKYCQEITEKHQLNERDVPVR